MSQSPFTPEQISELEQPLDRKRVKHRQGGGGAQLAYLKGHDVIDTANRIFGYGNWGYDLMGVELNTIPSENGEVIGGYYAARVRLTVAGCVPITEEGVCPIQEGKSPRAKVDAHDMARKGAITDALKRTLRCYGDQFGNSLYDTDLIDGQPRTLNTNRPAQPRPTPITSEAPAPRPVRVEAMPPAPIATVPTRTNGTAPTPVRPVAVSDEEVATTQQKEAIRKLAAKQSMNAGDLEAHLHSRYGSNLDNLSKADASHYIKVLQGAA